MTKRKKHLPLMVILWRDHSSFDGWVGPDDIAEQAKPPLIHSIGWKVLENNEVIVLCATIDEEDGTVGQMMNIAKREIVKKRIIRQPKTWK